jgi:hypothetical protein
MVLHLLYILAFTVLAFLAVSNLIRSLFTLGIDSQKPNTSGWARNLQSEDGLPVSRSGAIAHPELLDDRGNMIDEPLLVMRSMTVDDARERLDALYEASPKSEGEPRERDD